MPLPVTVSPAFERLFALYRDTPIEFPHLRPVTFAHWAKESGWGRSSLATKFNNYGGAKWRNYMAPWANPVTYAAHDGITQYCHFHSLSDWVTGYWKRFDLEPAYKGWRRATKTEASFLKFIGPIWLGMGNEAGDEYVRDVIRIRDDWKFADEFQVPYDEDALLDWLSLRRYFGLDDSRL